MAEDDSLRNTLIQNILSSYVRLVNQNEVNFVLQKLCSTLTAVFHKPTSMWLFPLRNTCASVLHGQSLISEGVPQIEAILASQLLISRPQIRGIVLVLSTLADEARTGNAGNAARYSSLL